MKKGFTLIEINLAMLIMATGVLVVCGLYSLGFRENRQSVEDVAATSFADTYLGPLMQGLSATNMTWSSWKQIGDNASSRAKSFGVSDGVWPKEGWLAYVQRDGNSGKYRIKGTPHSTADGVWDDLAAAVPATFRPTRPSISSDYEYALVATRRGTVIQLAFRAARRKDALMTQPIFVSEIRYQGDPSN